MESLIVIALNVLFVWLAYKFAEDRGRNGVVYAIAALFFSWLVLVLLALLGNTSEKALADREEEEEASSARGFCKLYCTELLAELKPKQ